MVKGVIFDLDGVLISADKYHYMAWKKIADKLNIEFNETINNKLRGVSRMASLEIILGSRLKDFSDHEKQLLADEKNSYYRELLQNFTPDSVSKDTINTLCLLKNRGLKLAVGSSSKNCMYILERTDLKKYFDIVVDGNMITKSKPDPEVFLKASEKLNLNPKNCFVIEDAIAGIESAKNGNFIAVGIGDAQNSNKCDYKIEKLSDILNLL